MNIRKKNGDGEWWKAAGFGAVISAGITVLMCGVFSMAILYEILPEENIGYASLAALVCSVVCGAYYGFRKTETKKMLSALCVGIIYGLAGIFVSVVMMKCHRVNLLGFSFVVLGCCTVSFLLGTGKGGGNRKRKRARMVKLNKKIGR